MSVIIDPESPASAVRMIREEMGRLDCTPSPQIIHNLSYLEKLTDKPVPGGMKRPLGGGARKTRKGRKNGRSTQRRRR
jgi:hypothetical protein